MSQLNPNQAYSIVRQLDNVNDTGTYYVQAVIKFSSNGNIYKTINLTDKGGQRFVGQYTTPTTGSNGAQIDITTKVYTDSGYITLSDTYGTTNAEHIVQQLFSPSLGFASGGSDLSPEIMRAIIKEEIKGIPMPKELRYDDTSKQFSHKLESHLNTFHDSICELHNKQDDFKNQNTKSLTELVDNLRGHFTKKLSENASKNEEIMASLSIVKKIREEMEDFKNEISTSLDGVFSRLDAMDKEIKSGNGRRLKDYRTKIKNSLVKMIETESESLGISEEEKPDYLQKALKLVG